MLKELMKKEQFDLVHCHMPLTGVLARMAAKKTKTYTVKKGDTLWDISAKYLKNGSRYVEIMNLSKITSTTIHVGQVLTLPAA